MRDKRADWQNVREAAAPCMAAFKRHSADRRPYPAFFCAQIKNSMLPACDQRASCETELRPLKAAHVDFDMVSLSQQS